MKTHRTYSIGIIAYNEEKNISNLVAALLRQRTDKAVLDQIFVISDGSTDRTVQRVRKIKNNKVKLYQYQKRRGKPTRENELFRRCTSDYLLIFDADTSPSSSCIQSILSQFRSAPAPSLLSVQMKPLPGNTFVERLLQHSQLIVQKLYHRIRKENPIYLCVGRALAYSRDLYSTIVLPKDIVSDDAYIFLYCHQRGYRYEHCDRAFIWYKLPTSLTDHYRQSERFFSSRKQLYRFFRKDFVNRAFGIRPSRIVSSIGWGLQKDLLLTCAYLLITVVKLVQVQLMGLQHEDPRWKVSHSSKHLR